MFGFSESQKTSAFSVLDLCSGDWIKVGKACDRVTKTKEEVYRLEILMFKRNTWALKTWDFCIPLNNKRRNAKCMD